MRIKEETGPVCTVTGDEFPPEIAAERASVVAHKLLTTPPRLRTIGKRHVADAKPERPEQAAEGS